MVQDPAKEGRLHYQRLMELFDRVLMENERIIAQILGTMEKETRSLV